MKIIKKIAKGKFDVITPNQDSKLTLDFNPIIEQFKLHEGRSDYKLIHWQAKPKGDRQWGVYDRASDSYSCGVWDDLPTFYGGARLLMLDDATATTIPSAVVYHVGSLKF